MLTRLLHNTMQALDMLKRLEDLTMQDAIQSGKPKVRVSSENNLQILRDLKD